MFKSYTSRSNAIRALKNFSMEAVKHASELIEINDGKYEFDTETVEKFLANQALPDETIAPEAEEELAAAIDAEESETEGSQYDVPDPSDVEEMRVNNVMDSTVCPKCGSTELYTGRQHKGYVTEDEYIIGCHECDWEEDVRNHLNAATVKGSSKEVAHDAQKTSLKLDRRITCVQTGEIWTNAHQMWKANPSWMTSAQQDRLTAKLYAAAKKGDKEAVEINGRHFELVSVGV